MNRRWFSVARLLVIAGVVLVLTVGAGRSLARYLRQASLNADLLDAIKSRDTRWAETLLERGANIEVRNHEDLDGRNWREDDLTPLALSIEKEDMPTVQMLLAHHANVHASEEDYNKLFSAPDIILTHAAKTGNVSLATLLLEKGAKVDVRGVMGETPLMAAVGSKHPPMVTFLLQKGAAVNAADDRGFTPLHLISRTPWRESNEVRQNRTAILRILRKAGAHM